MSFAEDKTLDPSLMPNASTSSRVSVLHLPKRTHVAHRRVTLALLIISLAILLLVIICGRIVETPALQTDFSVKNQPPCWEYPFGTDQMGRNMFLRTIAGLSTSILIGLGAAIASSIIALILGTIAALGKARADYAITWLIDLMMGIPHIVLLILISYALGKGFWGVTIGVALTHWPSLTRVIRAEVLQCKQSGFVQAAAKLGRSKLQIALTHMVPYVFPQFLVGLVLMFPHAILHEAAITFLGFGLSPDQAAIGIILSESMSYLSAGMWWLAVIPGVCLIAIVMLFNCVGSSFRRLIDPSSAQE